MKLAYSDSCCFRSARIALAVGVFVPVILAEESTKAAQKAGDQTADKTASKIEDYRSNNNEMNEAEVEAAFAQMEVDLKHLELLADAAPTAQQKAEAKVRYQILRDRRNELKNDFNRARYAALKFELQRERDKLSGPTKEAVSAKSDFATTAAASSETADKAAGKIAEYQNDSTEINKAEVDASLARLDADIRLLEAKINGITDSTNKAEARANLKSLKDRRGELNNDFRKARYDAIVTDVKAEWNKVVR